MAFKILGLLSPVMSSFSQIETIQADLGGGIDLVPELAEKTTEIRITLRAEAEKRRALALENSADFRITHSAAAEALPASQQLPIRAAQDWHHELQSVAKMEGPLELTKVVVVTGSAEVGPCGSARTRWEQVSRTTLWALVSMAEALVMSATSDPYELYEHVHISDLGISIGSGMGVMKSPSAMFRDCRSDLDVQKDILPETFINVASGWVSLLLMSSAGPVKTPVGACATALQSVEIAVETILSGVAKVMLAGDFDDFSQEGSVEFANMNATPHAQQELAAGREPSEMLRPATSTCAGVMESQGSGVQAIVAYSSTHTDKQGYRVPARAHGMIAAAPPLQRTLASWGRTADDIGALPIHGTSTGANIRNESHAYQGMFKAIGRFPRHAVPAMAQKWLCGHSKGGAACWALNEVIQSLQSTIAAGNRNADDVSPELRNHSYLLHASTSIQRTLQGLNAALLTSFESGRIGGDLLILHPAHVLAGLGLDALEAYKRKAAKRQGITYTRMHSALTHKDLVQVKDRTRAAAALTTSIMSSDPKLTRTWSTRTLLLQSLAMFWMATAVRPFAMDKPVRTKSK
ncbi:fatty acid synthase alpha subunit Lsd1 [Tilletia horrida]|nr:fatty acid synthase alpha subunit Lsd1 [Tilletia horrida]